MVRGHRQGTQRDELVRYRTIWISDLHLGTRGCKAHLVLDFLRSTRAERLYLVGDVVDAQQLARSWRWTPAHGEVVRAVLDLAREGTRVVYVPGNHDAAMRAYDGLTFGHVEVRAEAFHATADGRRLWVVHGDRFDRASRSPLWVLALGDAAYNGALAANDAFNRVRRRLGYPYLSISRMLKQGFKDALLGVNRFEEVLAREARARGVDGVVCGHVHRAEIRDLDGVLYCNDGDWVESCTALVEHEDGRLALLDWIAERAAAMPAGGHPLEVAP